MKKHLKYLSYVVRHKRFVMTECIKLKIPFRGLMHDMSKFHPAEWFPYVEAFNGEYGYNFNPDKCGDFPLGWSKNTWRNDRITMHEEAMKKFDKAWLRHQHKNKHHWQYWILREDDGDTKLLDMPEVYIREMVADWIGAGKAQGHGNDIENWYNKNKERILISDATRKRVEELIFEKQNN